MVLRVVFLAGHCEKTKFAYGMILREQEFYPKQYVCVITLRKT